MRRRAAKPRETTVLTLGHSTRSLEELLRLLRAHGVERLVDVRTVPRSRFNPQFNRDTLPKSVAAAGIGYSHAPELGGLRKPVSDSVNGAWRNASFRGFADYMQTPAFAKALDELIEMAKRKRIAILCAEAVPWRCHRSLICDALVARGIRAEHIMSETDRREHSLTSFAKVRGRHVTYPVESEPEL